MMSLLSRTKGYFVVICILMCGFLLTFSWRLLSSYDSTIVKPSTPDPHVNVRRFEEARSKSKNSSIIFEDESRSVVSKGSEISKQTKKSTYSKDDIELILSQITELGLSAKEFRKKFSEWRKHENRNNSNLPMHIDRDRPSSVSSIKQGYIAHRQQNKMTDSSNRERNYATIKTEINSSYKILPVKSDSGSHFRNRTSKYSVLKTPKPKTTFKTGHEEIAKAEQAAKMEDMLNNYREQKPVIGQAAKSETFKNNYETKAVIGRKNKPENVFKSDREEKAVIGQRAKDETFKNNRERNAVVGSTPKSENVLRINHEEKAGFEAPSKSEIPLKSDHGVTRTEQSRRQREKYLQFLREKFELSKRNTSGEVHRNSSASKNTHDNLYRTRPNVTNTMQRGESDFRADRTQTKLFDELSRKYPSFSDRFPKDDSVPEIQGTQRPDYCRGCFDFNFPIIIDHPKLCRYFKDATSRYVFLLVLIASAPGNYHARTVIRQTWGAKCIDPNSKMKCLFVIGQSRLESENAQIQLENDHHNDILQIGFKDSYANLTYKTISALKWTSENCYSAKYVMKTDDDMYVNTDLIPTMLQAAPSRKFMGGSCWGSSSPNRDINSKWFVSLKSFHKPKFPPMCSGTGYIMSMDVLRSVLFASRNVPFFHLEDVYVAMCLQKYGILPVNVMGFSNMFQEFSACHYKNGVMTSHQVPPELLEEFWPSMNRCPSANISPSQLYIIMPYPDTD